MLAALLLCAAVGAGLSQDYRELHYGDPYRIRLWRRAHTLTFVSPPDDHKVLWKSDNRSVTGDPRHTLEGNYYVMNQLTQKDNGRYDVWDKFNEMVSTVSITVVAKEQNYALNQGDDVDFEHDLPYSSCNIFFTSEDYLRQDIEVVRRGRVKNHGSCRSIFFNHPCRLIMQSLDSSCSGTYEIKDNNGNTALHVTLEVIDSSEPDIPSYGWVGICAAVSSVLCYCLKCCCCKKSSSKKDSSDSDGDEDATEDPPRVQYESEPARRGPRETPELPYTTEPSYPTAPPYPAVPPSYPAEPTTTFIHDSIVSQPPSYEETLALTAEPSGSLHLVTSTTEPRFEFTGMRFSSAPPLNSETTNSDVYTSDKLNFH